MKIHYISPLFSALLLTAQLFCGAPQSAHAGQFIARADVKTADSAGIGAQSNQRSSRIWDDITPTLEDILEREQRHETLPDSQWLGADKQSNQADINALMDEAIAILQVSSGRDYRQDIRAIEQAIHKTQQGIASYRKQKISAPKDSLWSKTVSDYDAAIKQAQTEIADYRVRIQELKREFAAELRTQGLNISDEQLDFLLSTVIGDDLISLSLAFDNVKAITAQLEQLLVDSGEDLTVARRYYGLYAVLLKALSHMHRNVLETIQRYVKNLDTVVDKTHTLMAESRKLSRLSQRHQRTLAANIEAQQLTLRTAAIYRDYLAQQARDVAQSKKSLAHDVAVARNTYETVKVSGDLVRLIQNGQHLLDSLFSRRAPTLFTFQNLEMKREFEKLTLHLRAAQDR